jgi:micrococcal nuclease
LVRKSVVLGLILATSMLGSTVALADQSGPSDPGGTFTDEDDSAHEGAIEAIAADDITKGCNPPANYLFCPDDPVTRGQMAAFLARALNLPIVSPTADPFADGSGTFTFEIARVYVAGITRGCNPPDNTLYCPDDPVTRGQMAAFLNRAFSYPPSDTDHFRDDDGTTFEDDINRLADQGVTLGCNPPANTEYCPDDEISREQMATFLMRSMGLSPLTPPAPTRVPVASITDGDTIRVVLNGVNEPLRFIGIDTPESGDECFEEASDAMDALVSGRTVRIDVDVSERDSLDRLLRYVFLTDGTFVNAEMVEMGWAAAPDFPPDSAWAFLFLTLEGEAQAADRGIWGNNCADGVGGSS